MYKKLRFRKLSSIYYWCTVFFLLSSLITYSSSLAQIGVWQTHFSYQSGQSVAVIGNKVYAATQNGFFYYDKVTKESTTLSKADGLSGVGISRILYLADQKRLLIAYQNGNLDFIAINDAGEPGQITNLNTIFSASNLPTARGINHLNRIDNVLYLSTDFGIVVLDLARNEIRDTYFSLRSDGTPLPIYQTAATTDSLYALTGALTLGGTGRRLRAIRFATSVNIVDPANWRNVTEPGQPLESIVANQGKLSATVNGVGIYERQSGRWTLTQSLANPIIRQFPFSQSPILATDKAITLSGTGSFSGALLADPRELIVDGNTIWVADTKNGLLLGNAGQFTRIAPEGPTRDHFVSLYGYPQGLIGLPVVPLDDRTLATPYEAFSVPNGRWTSGQVSGLTRGFNSAAYLSSEQKLYLSSFGSGLWSQADGQSPTAVTLPATISPFITSIAADIDGNLWLTTWTPPYSTQTILHVRRPDGKFESFPVLVPTIITQLVPDDNGFLWMRTSRNEDIFVVDPAGNRTRYLSTLTGQGGLLSSTILALVKDRTGVIWVGTDLGPTVFDNPAGAFDVAIDAQPPILNRRRLLANEQITSIAVDGGNRKWIGTTKGVYHVAPDGSQLLDTFTAENSPLPNNSVQAIAIEPTSGKVFIQTGTADRPYGIVSYQGPATEPADALSTLTIFPNPVRPDFQGNVGIKGLTDNATVKILDAGGKLVYETKSQGGTASWNLIDYLGRSVQTGIYLVVVVTKDGSEGLAGKLAVVR
ncbi:type IX secretion system anionic LPS delivery protein PorZ [Spirosoma harenae]